MIRGILLSFVHFDEEGVGLPFNAVDVAAATPVATKEDSVEEDGTTTTATLINHIRALATVAVCKITTLICAISC